MICYNLATAASSKLISRLVITPSKEIVETMHEKYPLKNVAKNQSESHPRISSQRRKAFFYTSASYFSDSFLFLPPSNFPLLFFIQFLPFELQCSFFFMNTLLSKNEKF